MDEESSQHSPESHVEISVSPRNFDSLLHRTGELGAGALAHDVRDRNVTALNRYLDSLCDRIVGDADRPLTIQESRIALDQLAEEVAASSFLTGRVEQVRAALEKGAEDITSLDFLKVKYELETQQVVESKLIRNARLRVNNAQFLHRVYNTPPLEEMMDNLADRAFKSAVYNSLSEFEETDELYEEHDDAVPVEMASGVLSEVLHADLKDIKLMRYVDIFDAIPNSRADLPSVVLRGKLQKFANIYGEDDELYQLLLKNIRETEQYLDGRVPDTLPKKMQEEVADKGRLGEEELLEQSKLFNKRKKEQAKSPEEIVEAYGANFDKLVVMLIASHYFREFENQIMLAIRDKTIPESVIKKTIHDHERLLETYRANVFEELYRLRDQKGSQAFKDAVKNVRRTVDWDQEDPKAHSEGHGEMLSRLAREEERIAVSSLIEGDYDTALESTTRSKQHREEAEEFPEEPFSKEWDAFLQANPDYFPHASTIAQAARIAQRWNEDISKERIQKLEAAGFDIFLPDPVEGGQNLERLSKQMILVRELLEDEAMQGEDFSKCMELSGMMFTWLRGEMSASECVHLTILYAWSKVQIKKHGIVEPDTKVLKKAA